MKSSWSRLVKCGINSQEGLPKLKRIIGLEGKQKKPRRKRKKIKRRRGSRKRQLVRICQSNFESKPRREEPKHCKERLSWSRSWRSRIWQLSRIKVEVEKVGVEVSHLVIARRGQLPWGNRKGRARWVNMKPKSSWSRRTTLERKSKTIARWRISSSSRVAVASMCLKAPNSVTCLIKIELNKIKANGKRPTMVSLYSLHLLTITDTLNRSINCVKRNSGNNSRWWLMPRNRWKNCKKRRLKTCTPKRPKDSELKFNRQISCLKKEKQIKSQKLSSQKWLTFRLTIFFLSLTLTGMIKRTTRINSQEEQWKRTRKLHNLSRIFNIKVSWPPQRPSNMKDIRSLAPLHWRQQRLASLSATHPHQVQLKLQRLASRQHLLVHTQLSKQ